MDMFTPLITFRSAEKLHNNRTNRPSAPLVPGGGTIWCTPNAISGMPYASLNLFNGGLRSLFSASAAWPNWHLASGCTCAHGQHSSGLISSLPPPCMDLLNPTRLTVRDVTFNASRTYLLSCTKTFLGIGTTVPTLYIVGYTHWCTGWILTPTGSPRLPICSNLVHVVRILAPPPPLEVPSEYS